MQSFNYSEALCGRTFEILQLSIQCAYIALTENKKNFKNVLFHSVNMLVSEVL